MKKILLGVIILFSIFIGSNAYAERDIKTVEQDLQKVQEDMKSANGTALDNLEAKKTALEAEKNKLSSGSTGCKYNEQSDLSGFLDGCKPKTVVGGKNMQVEGGFKQKINQWISNIALVLGIGAVGALVYAALLLQFANGEDEKIKKAKDIIKWTMIGFILLISASGVIYVVINVMFGLGG